MILFDADFNIIQGILFLITAIVLVFIAYTVYHRDKGFLVNQLFSLGTFFFALAYLISTFGNLYTQITLQTATLFTQLSYSLVVVSLMLLALSGFGLLKGTTAINKWEYYVILLLISVINWVVIWSFNGVYASNDIIGNTKTTILFKIVVYGTLIISYTLTYIFYIFNYKQVDRETIRKIIFFIIGWGIGGLGLFFTVISDLARFFDLLSPLTITIAVLILQKGFKNSTKKFSSTMMKEAQPI